MIVEFLKDGSVCLYHPRAVAVLTNITGLDIHNLVASRVFKSHGILSVVLLGYLDSLDGIEPACRGCNVTENWPMAATEMHRE